MSDIPQFRSLSFCCEKLVEFINFTQQNSTIFSSLQGSNINEEYFSLRVEQLFILVFKKFFLSCSNAVNDLKETAKVYNNFERRV